MHNNTPPELKINAQNANGCNFLCSDRNHSLNSAFILLTTIATSEEKQKLNAKDFTIETNGVISSSR